MKRLKDFYKNKKVLITGHTGFKGSWLSEVLTSWQAKVIGVALPPITRPNLFSVLKIKKKIKNYFCDIRDFSKVNNILKREKPEIIFHLAAQPLVRKSYDNPLCTLETNILGAANLLESVRLCKSAKSLVVVTTDKVYKERNSSRGYNEADRLEGYDPYSASKVGAEIVVDSYIKSFFNKKRPPFVASARAGNVIGGGDWREERLVPDIIRFIFENKKLILRYPEAIRPWQFVLEPLKGYLLLARQLYLRGNNYQGAYNFGPKKKDHISVKDLTKKMISLAGIKRSGIIKEEKNRNEKHEANFLFLRSKKAKDLLGWEPLFNIEQSLKQTFEWYYEYYNKGNIDFITRKQIDYFFSKE